jgi:hypothetical protein
MTNFQHCQSAVTLSACLEKVTQLFFVTHPKVPKPLLGPFLSEADAECGRIVMRSADAVVTVRSVNSIDVFTHGHAVNNGRVCRAFAGDNS